MPAVDLLNNQTHLALASTDDVHSPFCGYAPYYWDQEALYVLLSELSQQGKNLRKQNLVSVLIVDTAAATNVFAPKRLSLNCLASTLKTTDRQYTQIIDSMRTQLGETVSLIAGLGDFSMYRLQPQSGVYIEGFGKAFNIIGGRMDNLIAINPAK